MTEGENFWDTVEPSNKSDENVPVLDEPLFESVDTAPVLDEPLSKPVDTAPVPNESDYIQRQPQEISSKIVSRSTLAIIVIPILLLTAPFALATMGIIGGQDECWGSLEYLEDGKLHCVEGYESSNPTYSFGETQVTVSYTEGYSDLLRWELLGDGGVIGYAYYDAYSGEDDSWYSSGHCEWEGGESLGDEQWYCAQNEDLVTRFGFESTHFYCEFQELNWYCTDTFGQNSNFANTTNETRAGAEVLDKWAYDCLPVIAKSPFENTSMAEVMEIEASVVLPQWCYETPTFTENQSVDSILPFNGDAVYLYPNGIDFGSIDFIQFTEKSVRSQMISLHTYNEDGTLTEESEDAKGSFGFVGTIMFLIFYLVGGFSIYLLSTGRNHLEHLGTENTLVISKSWRNKPRTTKSKISLDSSSRLHSFTSTSTHTDSDGHTTTSTSHHHEITHSNRASDALPDGFGADDLLKVTGLELVRY